MALSEVFDTFMSLLTISIDPLRFPILKAPPWPTLSIGDPNAMLPHVGIHATWHYISHLYELVCVLTLAYESIPADYTALLPQKQSLMRDYENDRGNRWTRCKDSYNYLDMQ
jgi:hypothetical protein